VAAVRLDQDEPIAYYDGRATAEENWEERTGVARIADLGTFEALGDAPVGTSPYGLGGLRYVSAGTAARRRLPALLRGHAPGRGPRTTDLSRQGLTQMALPNFLIAGAPKAGTTALHVALARHPQLYLSRVKEPKYFLTDGRPRAQGGPGDAKTLREQGVGARQVRGLVR
jgi:hypothetical protein